ncbi:carbon-monoxide dehydrogenase medium subunit [Actinocatenispora thailandica]|uniref:Carbon-monoxide dehydrogenase medium subunit n=1 Tax=Actinocatenispora thailandica TaxID=227318 RepID=A0A7R7DMG2_9ACTN|nr:FAD binding domain-containing protein [Actinocatenispora thailandica]BCJ34318.1 carbon-monoxide dehydrogenase medium subunit [Actinocatenispora thailandica]
MDFLRPRGLAEALAIRARRPDAVPIRGGTDLMVELNFDRGRPGALLDLGRLDELDGWDRDGDTIRVGAGLPYQRIVAELATALPALAMASRTVGSPQIRNRGTVGGNLGSASPAGDAHPPLLVSDASIEVASVRGARRIPATEFYQGVKRSALAADELIVAVHLPAAAGPQQFAKVGTRNAMVIAVCSLALALDPATERVRVALGSAAPTPRRCAEAERFLTAELADRRWWTVGTPVSEPVLRRFGALVAAAAAPIDDVRGTADYRRRALAVLARRTATWSLREYRQGGRTCA